MFRRRLQKIGSLLGLLAILMSALAPTVSQALASRDPVELALAAYCTAQPASAADTGDGQSPESHALLHWQACAYCGLLAHVSVLPGVPATFTPTLTATRAPVFAQREEVRAAPLFTAAQPRAPPVRS
ncbi:DUF2946 domain-containing protein [Trinickia violacea]|uniref:DUF2946 domain-containing protein n=1 Tax=Trinickia violacea TaxID=2571746 RepID=A0A4P8IIJ5_9BURK|nr:DUF2946 domain-containing protein [Trinickia violacea]QCP48528.1 DUF2946 domain-containing protein [Trinickia violacea]